MRKMLLKCVRYLRKMLLHVSRHPRRQRRRQPVAHDVWHERWRRTSLSAVYMRRLLGWLRLGWLKIPLIIVVKKLKLHSNSLYHVWHRTSLSAVAARPVVKVYKSIIYLHGHVGIHAGVSCVHSCK